MILIRWQDVSAISCTSNYISFYLFLVLYNAFYALVCTFAPHHLTNKSLFPQIRVYLNIIYTIVEVMRCADPGDSEDIAQIQEMFFVELSKYSEFMISVYKDVHSHW